MFVEEVFFYQDGQHRWGLNTRTPWAWWWSHFPAEVCVRENLWESKSVWGPFTIVWMWRLKVNWLSSVTLKSPRNGRVEVQTGGLLWLLGEVWINGFRSEKSDLWFESRNLKVLLRGPFSNSGCVGCEIGERKWRWGGCRRLWKVLQLSGIWEKYYYNLNANMA